MTDTSPTTSNGPELVLQPIAPDLVRRSCVLGVDLGQTTDPTALCLIEEEDDGEHPPVYIIRHLSRLPLNTTYPGVVARVREAMNRPIIAGKVELVIDQTGVGRAVADIFTSAGVPFIGVTITPGDTETRDGHCWRVAKSNLVSGVTALLHEGRLKIAPELPEAATLVSELQSFKASVTESGQWRFGARNGAHDDLVLAVALAVWRFRRRRATSGLLEFARREMREAGFGGW